MTFQIRKMVEIIQQDNRISAAYLIGSVARRAARNGSDIDIAILPDPSSHFSGLDTLKLSARLGECSHFPADVGVLSTDSLVYFG